MPPGRPPRWSPVTSTRTAPCTGRTPGTPRRSCCATAWRSLSTRGSGGPLLGALPGYGYDTSRTPLRQGDTLLLYTDGMVEHRGEDVTKGIERLAIAMGRSSELAPRELIDMLLADPEQAGPDDDACMLAIRVD
ncbi:PP2C family protein-serine/threonine phosphatase [Streptomyces sp. NPDC047141]|uniref:PP2C family protein-serine/threonine phosphatase n=1 Tax=Streptomyces sp. NPDC047141 TaxID=3155738 RepID=UPI0033CFA01E